MAADDGENDLPIDDRDTGDEDEDEGGDTLADLLGRRIDLATAHAYLESLGAQLAAMHASGVVHGGLDPSRVLVHRQAGQLLPRLEIVDAGAPPMNLMYSAPERERGSFDARADVFSLGAIAHHAIVGVPPDRTGAPPSDLWPGIPGGVEALLVQMLSIDPGDRPLLDEARKRFAVLQAGPWWKSWKTATLASGVVVTAILAFLVLQPTRKKPTPTPTPVTTLPDAMVAAAPPPPPPPPPVVTTPDALVVVTTPDAPPPPPPPPPPVEKPAPVVETPPPPPKPAPKPKPTVTSPPPVQKPKPPAPPKKPKSDDDLMDPFGKK